MSCPTPVILAERAEVVLFERTDSAVFMGLDDVAVLDVEQAPAVVALDAGTDIVVSQEWATQVVLSGAAQGPPGPPGTGAPKSPTLTYTGSQLTGLAYADGSTKTLAYVDGRLVQVDFSPTGATATRKTLHYDGTGRLAQVSETTVP